MEEIIETRAILLNIVLIAIIFLIFSFALILLKGEFKKNKP